MTKMKTIQSFEDLKGETLTAVNDYDDELHFTLQDGRKFKLHHFQSCCESVYIESIVGDLDDLVGEPLLVAEEVNSLPLDEKQKAAEAEANNWGSCTWTFYKLATRKGYVDIRWFGESNGYYSECVYFDKV